MVVRYGPTDISGLESELKKLGSFHVPSTREMNAMEILHKEYRHNGTNNGKHDSEILKLLNIPNGQDVGTLNDSRYLKKGVDGTHIIFKLSSDGIRYMDYFYGLMLRKYEDLMGAIKNGYMENPDKRSCAHQWVQKHMVEIASRLPQTPITHQNISGIFFEVGGDMRNDGTILTDKDAVVGINVRGNYTSKKGKIIQGPVSSPDSIWRKYRDEIIIGTVVTVIGGFILAQIL